MPLHVHRYIHKFVDIVFDYFNSSKIHF
ncbi:MAG: protein FAM135 [Proteobacteria bacterium]|nr:protein FAM135 [Pseudomonadota bacterium]